MLYFLFVMSLIVFSVDQTYFYYVDKDIYFLFNNSVISVKKTDEQLTFLYHRIVCTYL